MKNFEDILKENENNYEYPHTLDSEEDDIDSYLNDEENTVDLPTIDSLSDDVYDDSELMDKMFELLTSIDPEVLTDEQSDLLVDILDIIQAYDDSYEEDMDESIDEEELNELAPKRKKINRVARRQRARKQPFERQDIMEISKWFWNSLPAT